MTCRQFGVQLHHAYPTLGKDQMPGIALEMGLKKPGRHLND